MAQYHGDHTEVVNTSLETLWKCMLEKVYHPELYVNGVSRSEVVLDRGMGVGDGGVERKMWPGQAPQPIHELITATEKTEMKGIMSFRMLTHPVLEGEVLNIAEAVDAGTTRLTISIRWTRKASAPPEASAPFGGDILGACMGAVLSTKAHAEAKSASISS